LIDLIFIGELTYIANKIGETLSHLNHILENMLMCHLYGALHE